MPPLIDTLLLLALPASGKSEVRRYLDHVAPDTRRQELCLGEQVQLDDFPYVHLMRVASNALKSLGNDPVFFSADDSSLCDPRDWGTLVELMNQDFADLGTPRAVGKHPGQWVLDRLEAARVRVGIPPHLGTLSAPTRKAVADAIDVDARAVLREHGERSAFRRRDQTLVIEFARGGKEGSPMPLAPPFGYRHSLSLLSPEILERAAILYVWVTPEESRRKNRERANPKDPASILHHGVPEFVMRNDYGCDDMDWLETHSDRPGSIRVEAWGRVWYLPIARFDNRRDRTSFLRAEPSTWPSSAVAALHASLSEALHRLAGARS
jgi:hypothetical protein